MINSFKEDGQKKIDIERDNNQTQGTISLKFKFKGKELEYNQQDCCIKACPLSMDDQTETELIILPIDLDINYSFQIGNGQNIRVQDMDYIIDCTSDIKEKKYFEEIEGYSSFFISGLAISPNEQFIFIFVKVKLLSKTERETERIIIIDLINQKFRKVLYKSYFILSPYLYFSKDGTLAIINISTSSASRYLLLNLSNGIVNQNIIKLQHKVKQIDYDEQSQSLYQITGDAEIFELTLNLQNLTIINSKIISYEPNRYFEFTESYEQPKLYLLGNRLAVIIDVFGQQFFCRINQFFKVIKYYNTNEQYLLQQVYKKILVVFSDVYKQESFLKNISTEKLIRKLKIKKKMYSYFTNQSYFLQIIEKSYDFDSNNEVNNWIIIDLLRGTKTYRQTINLTNKLILQEIFSRNLIVQNFHNKIRYNLKH